MRRIFVLLLLVLLTGCTYYAPPGEHHGSRVVTAVEVSASVDGLLLRRRYTGEEKMRTVLTYLRKLKPQLFANIDPETFRTNAFRITLTLSDGSRQVFHQLHDQYLQKNDGAWHSIDPAYGSALVRLLEELPSDG